MLKHPIFRLTILAGLAALASACASEHPTLAPTDDSAIHAEVLEDAHHAILEALDDTSRALPPMNALAGQV